MIRTTTLILAIAALIVAAAGKVDAGSYYYYKAPTALPEAKPAAEVLPATGRTIGGPALYEETGVSMRIYDAGFSNFRPTVCITLVNAGTLDVAFTNAFGNADVNPGQTRTKCDNDVQKISIECAQDGWGHCRVYWRIEQVDIPD